MLRDNARAVSLLVKLADVGTIALVGAIVGAWSGRILDGPLVLEALLPSVLWLPVADRLALYRSRRTERFALECVGLVEGLLVSFGLAALALSGLGVAMTPLLEAAALSFPVLLIQRAVVRNALASARKNGWNTRRLLIVGGGNWARELVDRIEKNEWFGIELVGRVGRPSDDLDGRVERLGPLDRLRNVLSEKAPDFVVLCPGPTATCAETQEVFRVCDDAGVACSVAMDHLIARHLQPRVDWLDDVPVVSFQPQLGVRWQRGLKRVMDIAVASFALLATFPVLVAIALAIKFQDGGPILFAQKRVGRRGRPFPCFKFRTMCVDAEAKLAALAGMNEVDGPVFKIKQDPRITRIGRFLRKYSLDEIPQLLNVLRGEMSMVGPRPPLQKEVDQYDWWQRRRISVRPGITCIWQVWGRNKVPFERWMEMDMQYIDNWSLWMDVKLMAHTVMVVFRGTGQ